MLFLLLCYNFFMNVQGSSPRSRAEAVDHAKILLGRLDFQDGLDEFHTKRREQFEAARPEEFLADLLAFYSFQSRSSKASEEPDVVLAFRNGVREVLPSRGYPTGRTHENATSASARTVTELLTKIAVGAPAHLKDPEYTRNFIAKLRDTCSPEDFKKNILPLIQALNKALAARFGVDGMGQDYHLIKYINGYRNDPSQRGLQLDVYDASSSQTTEEYARDLLKQYRDGTIEDHLGQGFLEKKDVIVPRLEAILARIETLRASTPEIANVQIFLPKLDKDHRVLAYDVETEVGLVEDQLEYFEKYIAERNRKQTVVAEEKRRFEESAKISEIFRRLSTAEMSIADLLPKIQKLQGPETEKGSVALARFEAENNVVRVHIAKGHIQGCFHEIEPMKRAAIGFSRDRKYVDAVCAVIDPAIGSLEALQSADSATLARNKRFLESKGSYKAVEWQKTFTSTDTQLPGNDVKGEARLGVLEPMNSRLTAQKPVLDAAYTEADTLKKELAPQCAQMIARLTGLKGKIRALLATKSDDGIRERVHDELETFRKENANIFA